MKIFAVLIVTLSLLGTATQCLAVEGDILSAARVCVKPDLQGPQKTGRDTLEIIIGTPAIGNVIPFWGSSHDACRFQVLFLQSEINTQGDIVEFAFMPSGNSVGTYNNVRVAFCHTSVSQLGAVFDNNYAGNTPVEVINESSMAVGGPASQWMPWDVSFSYNNVDNLLVEIKWSGDNNTNVALYRTSEAVPRRLYAWDDNASSGSLQNTSNYVRLKIATVGIEEESDAVLKMSLKQNYPNPFTKATSIEYSVTRNGRTKLSIYDASGRLIKDLVNEVKTPGIHTTTWDGKDEAGKDVINGVYFYRLQNGNSVQTRKMIYLQ